MIHLMIKKKAKLSASEKQKRLETRQSLLQKAHDMEAEQIAIEEPGDMTFTYQIEAKETV